MRNHNGFTMVEMVFVAALLPLLVVSVMGMLQASNQIFRINDVYTVQNEAIMQGLLRSMSREIEQTSSLMSPSHLNISNAGPEGSAVLRFQIPVDWDGDGDALCMKINAGDLACSNSTNAAYPMVEWGAYDEIGQTSNGRFNGWVRYQLVDSNSTTTGLQLVRDVLDSGLGQIDGSVKILASNIQAFTAVQTSKNITVSLTSQKQEPMTGRTYTASFSQNLFLRNSVS